MNMAVPSTIQASTAPLYSDPPSSQDHFNQCFPGRKRTSDLKILVGFSFFIMASVRPQTSPSLAFDLRKGQESPPASRYPLTLLE